MSCVQSRWETHRDAGHNWALVLAAGEGSRLQPRNRGTANGILLPLLRIMHRDPQATLLILPSDHYVRNEDVLASSLRRSIAARQAHVTALGRAGGERLMKRILGLVVLVAVAGCMIDRLVNYLRSVQVE